MTPTTDDASFVGPFPFGHLTKRPALEAANEKSRVTVGICTPYYQAIPPSFTTSLRTFDEVKDVVYDAAMSYVARRDLLHLPLAEVHRDAVGLSDEEPSWTLNSIFLKCFGAEPPVTLSTIFSPNGDDASHITTKSALRAHTAERSDWADLVIRAHTLHHNGVQTCQTLLHDAPGMAKLATDSKSRFLKAARNYKIPTEAQIRAKMPEPGKSESTHPFLAAGRYLTVAGLRAVAAGVEALQEDPCISSNHRDKGGFGGRPINQLKDLSHSPVSPPEGIIPGTKTVRTLIDCLAYETSLAEHSGHDIIIWTSYYPDLAGETSESVYYADSDKTFVEIVGKHKATAIYKKQGAWDFTASDIIYIENEDHSAFTVYQVIRHFQPDLLKQVVFLCALQTVNLPYAIVNQLVRWTKGHDLGSVGIGTPKLCGNVMLVPRDPERPYTQDILVMSNGTPGSPTVSIKYKNEISPRSCATMSTEVYNYLKYLNAHGGRGLTVHEAIKRLELFSECDDVCVPGSAAYCELLRTVAWWGDLPNVVYYGLETSVEDIPVEMETAKAVKGGPQITLNNPGVLAKTPEAMDAYVEHKMIGLKNNTVPTEEWTKISDVILNQFIKCIAQETGVAKGSLQLVDREEILAARTKRVQKARQVTDGMGPSTEEIGRVENKVEAAHKTGPCPRGIQNPAPDVSVESGILGKTLELVLKKTSWYNPGSTPQQISDSVSEAYIKSHGHELKYRGGGVRSVDYTGADEGHSTHSNRVLRGIIDYFVADGDKAEAQRIYASCFDMPLQVGPMIKSSGKKNASGTGITTVLNTGVFGDRELETTTVAMVFRSMEDTGELKKGEYIKSDDGADRPFPVLTHKTFLRHLRIIQDTWGLHKLDGKHTKKSYAIEIAYGWIGPKFGDDGLDPATPFVDDGTWERAMLYVDRMDGFVRKLETTSAVKEEPVEYLSRIYPCPLRSPSSYCKVEKAVDKISLAVNRDQERYGLKLHGYWTTDRTTPIVGAYLTALSRMYGMTLASIEEQAQLDLLYEHERELYWKVAPGPFPWDENAGEEQYASVAADYNMTSGELREFDALLAQQSTWSGIQAMMVPAKVTSETPDDPLGLQPKSDPPGVTRVPAFSTSSRGEDPRMCNFESADATGPAPSYPPRDEAAKLALGL